MTKQTDIADRIPTLLLVIGVLSVSVSGLIAHRALVEASPLMLAAWRMGAASIFFLLLNVFSGRANKISITKNETLRLVFAGLVLALHFVIWFKSLDLTTVTVATLLVCTTPIWTALGQVALRRSSPDRTFIGLLFVALIGIVLVVNPKSGNGTSSIQGDLYALGGGAAFAIYLLLIDGLQHISSQRIVASTYTVASIVLWAIVFALGRPQLHYSFPVWEAIALLAIVPQIVGHTLINNALRHFQAHIVAFSILAEPVIAAILASILLHESMTYWMLVGAVLVIVSMGLVLRKSPIKSQEPAEPL